MNALNKYSIQLKAAASPRVRINLVQVKPPPNSNKTPKSTSVSQRRELQLKKVILSPSLLDNSSKAQRFKEDFDFKRRANRTVRPAKKTYQSNVFSISQKLPPIPEQLKKTDFQKQKIVETILPKISLSSIQINYQRILGRGSEGMVYEALGPQGQLVAVKEVKNKQLQRLEHDLELVVGMDHPNIVKCLGYEVKDQKLFLFLEKMQAGSLDKLIQQFGPIEESVIKRMVRQILKALIFLHQNNIVHRDIKGANVLFDGHSVVKLTDLGSAKRRDILKNLLQSSQNSSSIKGSFYWMAPEILLKSKQCRRSDIWSLGCLIIELATGKHPWQSCFSIAQFTQIIKSGAIPKFPQNFSQAGTKFLQACCQHDSRARPQATSLLCFQWMD